MAALFETEIPAISKHIKRKTTVSKMEHQVGVVLGDVPCFHRTRFGHAIGINLAKIINNGLFFDRE